MASTEPPDGTLSRERSTVEQTNTSPTAHTHNVHGPGPEQQPQDQSSARSQVKEVKSGSVKVRNKAGKIVTVEDTPKNRELQVEQIKQNGLSALTVDGKFEALASGTKQNAAPKEIGRTDNSEEELAKFRIGSAYMDITKLENRWDTSDRAMHQRGIKPHHVEKLVNKFEEVGFNKVSFGNRMLVAMTDAELQACIEYTIKRLQDIGSENGSLASQVRQERLYKTDSEFPRLLMAPNVDGTTPVRALVQAGQHRIKAMEEYEARHLPDGITLKTEDLICGDDTQRGWFEKCRGWTITIVDKDRIHTPEGQRALAIIRRNEQQVAETDSPGTLMYQLLYNWNNVYSQEDRDRYSSEGDFKDLLQEQYRMDYSDSIKRMLTTPKVPRMLELFLACRWAQDLYTQETITQLIDKRMIEFISLLVKKITFGLDNLIEPAMMGLDADGKPYPPKNSRKLATMSDVESLSECFVKGTFRKERWTGLFFPDTEDKFQFQALPKLDVRSLKSIKNKMPEKADAKRGSRQFRRPMFLEFLSAQEYEFVHDYGLLNENRWRRVDNPTMTGTGELHNVVLPTKEWWRRFCKIDTLKLHHVVRFHYFCAFPKDYRLHIRLSASGSGNLREKEVNKLDIQQKFRTMLVEAKMETFDNKSKSDAKVVDINDVSEDDDDDEMMMQRKIQERNARMSKVAEVESDFQAYLLEVWKCVCVSPESEARFRSACLVLPEYFTKSHSRLTLIKFYRAMLEAKFMRPMFIDALIPHLGADVLVGITAPLGERDIGKPGSDEGSNFWDLSSQINLDANKAASAAVNTMEVFSGRSTKQKAEIVKQLETPITLYMLSIALENSSDLLDVHKQRQEEIDEGADEVIAVDDSLRFLKADKNTINNYDDWNFHCNVVGDCVAALRSRFEIHKAQKGFPADGAAWLDLSADDRAQFLPHLGSHSFRSCFFYQTPDGTILQRPVADDLGEEIEHLDALLKIAIDGPRAIDIRKEATAYMEKMEEDKQKGRAKAQKRAAKRKGLSSEIVESNDDGGKTRRKSQAPKSKTNSTKGKQQEKTAHLSPEEEGQEEEDDVDSDASSELSDALDLTDWSTLDWELESNLLPTVTAQAIYDHLKLDDVNSALWEEWNQLSTKDKSEHTRRAKAGRVKLLNEFVEKERNQGVDWVVAASRLGPLLAYDTEAKWNATHQKIDTNSGPAKPVQKSGKGTGNAGQSAKGKRGRAPSTSSRSNKKQRR